MTDSEDPIAGTAGDRPDPSTARGAQTLLEVIDAAAERGFVGTMIATDTGETRCDSCRSRHGAAELTVVESHRLEGASDPSDMLIVVLTRCPASGDGATMTLGFGPNGSEADEAVLARLDV